MKNCIVKMVVKNKNRTNPQENNLSDINEEPFLTQTLNRSKASEDKQTTNIQIQNLLHSFEKIMKSVSKPTPIHDIEPRDRKIVFDLPQISKQQKLPKRQLEMWITQLCKQVFSTAFHYYEKKYVSYDQAKIYCSQNIISNIIRLNQIYSLSSDQIKMIDDHINSGVTEYLLSKYPMTQINIVNKTLEASVKETDNIEALENDIFFYSEDSFGFEYRQTGNYNDLIMKMMNFLMSKTDESDPISKVTLYEGFYEFMQKTFELIESRDFMDGANNLNNRVPEDLNKKVEDEKYKSRVKAYTSWLIGRKISENVSQYTQAEIQSLHMPIKSPAILRILTKWCDQLWAKFNKKNYFLDRTENVKCQKGNNVNTYFAWMKTIINDMVEQEKLQIQRYMDQLQQNNYDQQSTHIHRSLRGNYFNHVQKYEKAAGVFTINIVNNLHSYILLYLNRLIHGLLKVSKRVYDKELMGRARWTSPPNLISFKIGDLMRCKIGSQQKEILKLFRVFTELNEKQPQKLKIIRIKNRLKEGTNDILMNIRYKNIFICQIQLGVNSDHSNFIKCSNKYNHFIYEVKRSIFGPITEFCSIWKSLDGRCRIYEKMAISKKEQTSRQLKNKCEQSNKAHIMQRYNQPFVCSKCHQTYSHSNYIWSHHRCQKCITYTVCCKCRIDSEEQTSLKNKLFRNNQDLKGLAFKIKENEEIPQYGICFCIQSKYLHLQKFVKWNIKGKVGLYCRNGKDIELITELNTKKQIQAFKDQYVIFKIPIDEGSKIVRISELEAKNEYLLPKLVRSIYKKQKEFISLIGQELNDQNMVKILDNPDLNNRNRIKFLQLPDNNIEDIGFICDKFRNLNKLVLSRNKIKTIDQMQNLISLQQLNIRDNLIEVLPLSLFKLFKLESLNIRNNKFNVIPNQISKLTNLTKIEMNQLGLKELPKTFSTMLKLKYIDLTKNKLGKFPKQLEELKQLEYLALSSNGIEEIPGWIGGLKELRVLELNKNLLKTMPNELRFLTKLVQLQIENNKFQELDFICPQSINVILANSNAIRSIDESFFAKCVNIAKMQLNNNQIASLPKNLGVICSKMKNLSLNSNKLTDLPSFFGVFLPSIQLLELNKNEIKAFPKALKKCTDLVELHLSENPLQGEIYEQFLTNNFAIQKFDFSKTKISKLPNLSLAPSLKRLNFSETNLKSEHLQVLNGLQYAEQLIIQGNGLTQLPQSIKELHYLHILDLTSNQLQTLEDDLFTKITHLRQLILDNNRLSRLPPSIKSCRRIKNISCNNNKFTSLPQIIYSLSKIEKISFGNNLITNLEEKLSLPLTLKELRLSKNKIATLPERLFRASNANIKVLDLSDNELTAVPRSLRQCFKLSTINFTGNRIVFDVFQTTKEMLDMYAPSIGNQDDEEINNDRQSLLLSFLS